MQDAAAALVKTKDQFDVVGRNYVPGNWRERLIIRLKGFAPPSRRWTAVHPAKFVMQVLPFSVTYYDYEKMQPKYLDPQLIVSGTYNDYSSNAHFTPAPPSDVMDRSDRLATPENKYHPNSPRVCRIGALPLYVALEGKNRVELFKNAGRQMKALVTEVSFPEADQLTLYRSLPLGIYSVSYKDDRRVLPMPEAALPLLVKYGVKTAEKPLFSLTDYFRLVEARRNICRDQMMN
ncbi:Doublecortin domain-containing protein [Pseudomonas sp. IT-P100]|uniref:hypothetical protein n=1 Tax=Pseudomonas sp. IT-P100 TaxID=3026452 RepID=UPI0039E16D1A